MDDRMSDNRGSTVLILQSVKILIMYRNVYEYITSKCQ